ncbi:hypothetical protein D3W54_06560 [Komagataeibacter medellinensis]|uniref:Transposase n=1 Tax=Komagataeibacter medellinensis TaxID=1177712 RepID=A0ABQ6VUN1_9PROT|nr:hypothetical protein D3W54_06560 [Komagataeibacter medellinensis]
MPASPLELFEKPVIVEKFLVKLFSKSFEGRRLFEKRRHPKIFILYLSMHGWRGLQPALSNSASSCGRMVNRSPTIP